MAHDAKAVKRFNNGHKTFTFQEQEFLKETYNRERSSLEKFVEKAPTLRKARNPTNGELTPRIGVPTTELWMPNYEISARVPDNFESSTTVPKLYETNVNMASAIKIQKDKIENELLALSRVVERKQEKLKSYGSLSYSKSKYY
jgi:hypothetical protein